MTLSQNLWSFGWTPNLVQNVQKTSWVSKIILKKLLIFKKFSCSWKPHVHSPSVEHPENKLSLFQIIKLKLIHVRTIIEASQKLIFHLNIPRIMRTADSRICVAFPRVLTCLFQSRHSLLLEACRWSWILDIQNPYPWTWNLGKCRHLEYDI